MKTKLLFSFFLLFLFLFADISSGEIKVKSSLHWVHRTTKVSACVVHLSEFQEELVKVKTFDFTNDDGVKVLTKLVAVDNVVVSTYRTINPLSKVIAYRVRNEIYFNLWKNPRDMKELVNTFIHESLHIAGYGHGGNSPVGKKHSVPYFVGAMAEKYVSKCEERIND
jgi:hypothetical protein